MTLAREINVLVEQMPKNKQSLLLELIKSMISLDDFLTDDDIADIKQARAEFSRGEYVRHQDINWE